MGFNSGFKGLRRCLIRSTTRELRGYLFMMSTESVFYALFHAVVEIQVARYYYYTGYLQLFA